MLIEQRREDVGNNCLYDRSRPKNRFGELIDQAQREPIEITRRGRPVAYVVCGHDLKALADLSTRREEAVRWYANDRRTTATSPGVAVPMLGGCPPTACRQRD
ncbi:type II toxin-antitoxin system prevent-host-death family antitoxin [Lamprocystis purpurea]|uniref:type II toxin-antitoxin system prevent-host-death family antitoxin n=1 Tax=Lamprocystis purpurea TaxID=61598 RepID=UPI001FE104CA|nr:type II toxin-antitoxin system prevent-host-death family antitoxin [Lamprocystis purpurea]